eukprot:CAMPEP_0194073054 /NCGR_PEP_ID=MMETSP0149-20130528/609_1 /TAXON_ID=122233 /ORGANISM="Chaetoceros debilis, Strain MM31A-1" /LENGTH=376 /DNA_ID=CAMNT_0038753009 /DNA_START=52 /DNA_END=1182 /DNA_ORIENTATION=-
MPKKVPIENTPTIETISIDYEDVDEFEDDRLTCTDIASPYQCQPMTDFGFEVDEGGRVSGFDTSLLSHQELKDDIAEWILFIKNFSFLDEKKCSKKKKKSSTPSSKVKEMETEPITTELKTNAKIEIRKGAINSILKNRSDRKLTLDTTKAVMEEDPNSCIAPTENTPKSSNQSDHANSHFFKDIDLSKSKSVLSAIINSNSVKSKKNKKKVRSSPDALTAPTNLHWNKKFIENQEPTIETNPKSYLVVKGLSMRNLKRNFNYERLDTAINPPDAITTNSSGISSIVRRTGLRKGCDRNKEKKGMESGSTKGKKRAAKMSSMKKASASLSGVSSAKKTDLSEAETVNSSQSLWSSGAVAIDSAFINLFGKAVQPSN